MMNQRLKSEEMDRLFTCILQLQSIDECYAFFDDLCTIHELQAMTQRLEVAVMLREGRTYTEIGEATGASTATISRVNRALNYGSDGYSMVLNRVDEPGKGAGDGINQK